MTSHSDSPLSRSVWSSRLAFILVSTGAAIGLGNIWRFPYMAGDNGGGVFVITYMFFLIVFGIPAMIAELMIGRRGQNNAVDSLKKLAVEANRTTKWQGLGWLGALTLIMVLSFYSVISGVAIGYLNYAIQGAFNNTTPDAINALWSHLLNQPILLIGWHTVFMVLTMLVVAFGINQGIEKASRWMMPALFFILIALVIYGAIKGNFKEALSFLFSFKVQDFNAMAAVGALGQAFFTLATGAGAILVYGSYLSKQTNIVNTVFIIAALDLLVAMLAGLAIFPIVFANGLAPDEGPGLMFKVLPIAFSQMPAPQIVGSLFFTLLIFAAWTSSLSMAEPLVSLLSEKTNMKRGRASVYVGALTWALGIISALAFSIWRSVEFYHFHLFDFLLGIPTNIFLPIGALLFCVFAGWIMKEKDVSEELDCQSPALYFAWRIAIRYLCPISIVIVFITNII